MSKAEAIRILKEFLKTAQKFMILDLCIALEMAIEEMEIFDD